MYDVVLVRARNLQQLVASIRRRAEDGWQVCGLGQEKKKKYNKHLRWYAVLHGRDMVKEHETANSLPADVLPLSERRARAGDPAAYRSADESKQKEPDPQP